MKADEIIIGEKYLFVNNGNHEHKKEFHNQIGIVLKRIKGKSNTKWKTSFKETSKTRFGKNG